jgi:excisionase family DNA binding protein
MDQQDKRPPDLTQGQEIFRPPQLGHQENQFKDLHLWMTTQEAAEYSGYDVQYVRRLARQGKIGAVKKGRDWWIDVEVFTAYLNTMLDSEDGRVGAKATH